MGRPTDLFTSDDTDEWATPPEFVRPLADALGGFDLDPCSGAEQSPIAEETVTEGEDGLSKSWYGDVWANPPYSDVERWTRKAVGEAQRDETDCIVLLVKGDSSTDWWQFAAREADAIALLDGRLSFGDGKDAPFPSHVFVFGEADAIVDIFDRRGIVFRPGDRHERAEQRRLPA